MKKLLVGIICLIGLISCENKEINSTELHCLCPHTTLIFQPYEDFSTREIEKLIPNLMENLNLYAYGHWEYKILKPIPIPFQKTVNNRYQAKKFLVYQKQRLKNSNSVLIGLTHKDICANVHNVENYGILGYSYRPGQVCIISDKRLSNKSDMWKIILHEFMHAYYGAGHCPNNDPTCFMKDAKGHGNFQIQNKLCNSCRQ